MIGRLEDHAVETPHIAQAVGFRIGADDLDPQRRRTPFQVDRAQIDGPGAAHRVGVEQSIGLPSRFAVR